jgi:hypothetical protein
VTSVCANFYDVHGGGKFGTSNFQKVNGTNEITVDANGDNSIKTNAFNTAQGTNCVTPSQAASLTTAASGPVTIGGSIKDTATLSNAASPTGSITFKLYAPKADGSADPTCSTLVATLGPVTVNGNGSYDSPTYTPSGAGAEIAGTYQWIASYGGDANNPAATGKCGDPNEQSVVNRHASAVPTQQTVLVSDFAKVTSSGGTPTGSVTFKLFSTSDCSGNPLFAPDAVPLDATGVAHTDDPTPLSLNGTYSWLVSYAPAAGSGFEASSSSCGSEQTSISGNTPGIAP